MLNDSYPRRPHRRPSRRGNPLLRRSDRIERRASILLVLLALVMLPLSVVMGARTIDSQLALSKQQSAEYSTVTATTVADAFNEATTSRFAASEAYEAPAEWTWGNAVRKGDIAVYPATQAGSHEQIWVDQNGNLAQKPVSPAAARVGGVIAGLFTWFAVMAIGLSGLAITRILLNRARYAQWDREIRQYLDSSTRH